MQNWLEDSSVEKKGQRLKPIARQWGQEREEELQDSWVEREDPITAAWGEREGGAQSAGHVSGFGNKVDGGDTEHRENNGFGPGCELAGKDIRQDVLIGVD